MLGASVLNTAKTLTNQSASAQTWRRHHMRPSTSESHSGITLLCGNVCWPQNLNVANIIVCSFAAFHCQHPSRPPTWAWPWARLQNSILEPEAVIPQIRCQPCFAKSGEVGHQHTLGAETDVTTYIIATQPPYSAAFLTFWPARAQIIRRDLAKALQRCSD